MTLHELCEYIYFQLQESIEIVPEVDYDNLKFLPEHNIDFSNPDTVNKCSTFKIDELKNIRSWAGKQKYLENCLPKLGSGSARVVYLLEPTKVIKLARNDKGIAQNEAESRFSSDSPGAYSDVLAHVIDYDKDYLWVEMEVAKKLNAKVFKQATGLSWKKFASSIRAERWYQDGFTRNYNVPEEVQENEFFSDIVHTAANYNLMLGDLDRANSYGVVERDGKPEVVIVDMGLTPHVYSQHYDRRNKTEKRNHFYN